MFTSYLLYLFCSPGKLSHLFFKLSSLSLSLSLSLLNFHLFKLFLPPFLYFCLLLFHVYVYIAIDRERKFARGTIDKMQQVSSSTESINWKIRDACTFSFPRSTARAPLKITSFVSLCAEVGSCSRPIREVRSCLGAISLDANVVASEIILPYSLSLSLSLEKNEKEKKEKRTRETIYIHPWKHFSLLSLLPSFASDRRIRDARFPFEITEPPIPSLPETQRTNKADRDNCCKKRGKRENRERERDVGGRSRVKSGRDLQVKCRGKGRGLNEISDGTRSVVGTVRNNETWSQTGG